MKYSIIIAVYNRLEEVKELLESAEKLEGDRRLFELLFVDDGSKDGFKEFIEQYRLPADFKYEPYTNKIKALELLEITE